MAGQSDAGQSDAGQSDASQSGQKSFADPDETREFERGRLDLLQTGGAEIGRLTLQPG